MDKELRVKIKIDSETAKLDTLNSKINNTSKSFDNADSMASAFTSKLDALNSKIKTVFDSKQIDDMVKKTLDPYGHKLDEINKKWQTNLSIMQRNGGNTSGIFAAWNKEISNLETSKLEALNNKINNTSKSFDNTGSMVSSFTNRILMLGGAYLTLNAAIDGGKSFIHQADTMKSLDGRLKLATSSSAEYTSQQKELTKISLDSYTAVSDTVTLFTKLNPALKQVGASTEQVDTVVGSFTKGLQLGGKTAAESSSAILQFSQAMGSGVLRGEEFNAMTEAAPKLLEYMAKGLGVPQTALKQMAENGELTAVKVSNALLSVKSDIERDFKTMPVTVEKAMTNLSTYMSLGIRDIDNATGASTALSGAIIDFGKNISDISGSVITFYEDAVSFTQKHNEALDTTGTILKTVTAAYIGFTVTSGIATGIGVITASVYALRTSILLLETSIPIIGWVAAAVGTAAGAYVLANDMMDESNNKSTISLEIMKKKVEELQQRRDSLAQNKYTDSNVKTINAEIEAWQSKIKLQEQFTKKQIHSTTDIFPKEEKTAITELLGEYNGEGGYVKTIDKIIEKKKAFSELTKEIQKEVDPIRAIKEEYEALRKSIKGTEADTPEYNKKINENELDAIAKLDKDKISKAKETAKKISEVEAEFALIGLNEWDTKFKELDNKYNADLVKYAGVVGAKTKIDLLYEDNKKNLANQKEIAVQKEDLSYYERKIQLQDDSLSKELELQGVNYSNRIFEIENTTKSLAEKNKLIDKETELFNLTVQNMTYKDNLEFENTMSSFYDDMLDSQLALNNAVYDFGSGFDGVSSKIGGVSKSLAAMSQLELTNKREASKLDKKYIDQFVKYADQPLKIAELEQQYTKDTNLLKEKGLQAELAGYGNIAGAMSNMFKQNSAEAEAFTRIQATIATLSGTIAVLEAAKAPPPIGLSSMLGMGALVTSILANAGVAFGGIGGTKTTTSSDAFSAMTANNGSGSVLGDSEAASKSITNALSTLEDFAKPEYQTLLSMNNYLETIASNISGVSSILVRNAETALGKNFTGGYDTGFKNNIGVNNTLGALGIGAGSLAIAGMTGGFGALGALSVAGPAGLAIMAVDKLLLGGAITNLIGGVFNNILGGLFGKTSVSVKLKDSGITFADAYLKDAVSQLNGSVYQTIKKTTTEKSWFSSSSSSSIKTYFSGLNDEIENQFSLVLGGLYNTVFTSGQALELSSTQLSSQLDNFVVSIGKISLKDKTGTEVQELLTNVFSQVGDDLTKATIPYLTGFQKVGEGLFETLTRVATGMQDAKYYIDRLGFSNNKYTDIINKQGDVGFESLLQSIEKVEKATYPLNNNLLTIVDSLDLTAEELYAVYTTLDGLRDRLIFLGQSSQGISNSMIYGAGSVDALSSGFNSYFENFLTPSEQLTFKTQQLSESFTNLGIQMPTTNKAFKTLLSGLDLTSESGQELYGRLITLNDSFAEISSLRVNALQDELDITTSSISNIKEISTSLDSVITSLRSGLDNSSTNLLDKFNRSMATSLLLSNADDYTALANSVKESINYSSALNNSDYFGSLRDMQFAQSVAANNFENININLEDELSVLQKIANNTNEMIDALSNLTTAVKTLNDLNSTIATNTADSRIA